MSDTIDSFMMAFAPIIEQKAMKKEDLNPNPWPEDSGEAMKRIQSVLTDMAFKKSKIQQEMEAAQERHIRKFGIALRRCFLERFRFPMMLARGEFICFHGTSEVKVFYYEGQPFAAEKRGLEVNTDGNEHCGTVYSRIYTIFDDFPLRTIIKTFMDQEKEPLKYAEVNPTWKPKFY